MAFDIANLTLMAHGNGRNVYYYSTTADTIATILASGYFGQDSASGQQSSDMLSAGDLIIVSGSDGLMNLRVDTVSGTTVTTEVGAGEAQWLQVSIATLTSSGGQYVPAPFDGVVRRVKAVTNGEIDTTTVLTVLNGGVAMTGGTISLDQSGQGAGEVYSTVCTAGNSVSENDAVQVTWDGAATLAVDAAEADVTVYLEFVPA